MVSPATLSALLLVVVLPATLGLFHNTNKCSRECLMGKWYCKMDAVPGRLTTLCGEDYNDCMWGCALGCKDYCARTYTQVRCVSLCEKHATRYARMGLQFLANDCMAKCEDDSVRCNKRCHDHVLDNNLLTLQTEHERK